ncbi:MAG: hypothetical protein KGZ70_03235 [Hydrogenophaga sp.]|uniref:hypothetical protein n=1 Tax=Hydrogenophaga sp. TaxID=1904254 RepID=UPI001BC09D05|nr:hypothetical protein [Hydrogenophaga sp.]MBS3910842.1 hypothetical protein [Hydrogenophaga sp.]MDP2166066.1 hypothetical protein [Hydrogenophaga sp.]MDP3477679.1 hypothetical protein [Hydrogenophaga sp.]
MTPRPLARLWLAGLLLPGMALPSTVRAMDCGAPTLGLAGGREHSRWAERDARGNRLLTERGWLDQAALTASGHCGTASWQAQWAHSQGQRRYDGQTQTGTPVQTSSRLRVDALTLSGWQPLGALDRENPSGSATTSPWAWGARLGWRQTDRRIASTTTALGYPERFRAWELALGARWRLHDAGPWRLSASGWAGGGPGGTARVSLPNADPLNLPLGHSRLLALGLQLDGGARGAQSGAWSWQLRLETQHETTAAGSARAVTRNGVPVAVATMPEIRQRQTSISAALNRRF